MTEPTPSAAPFILRLIAAADQGDALGAHSAVADAEAAGVSARFLIVVLTSMLQELMTDRGYTLGDLHRILLEGAAGE